MKSLLLTLAIFFTIQANAGDPLKSKEDWERALYVEGVVIKLTAIKDIVLPAFELLENRRHKDRHLTMSRLNDYSIPWEVRPIRMPMTIKTGSVFFIYPYGENDQDVYLDNGQPHPELKGFSAGYFKSNCGFSTGVLFECSRIPLRLTTLKSDFEELGLKMELGPR